MNGKPTRPIIKPSFRDRFARPSDEDMRRLTHLLDVMQIMRKRGPEMANSYVAALLTVASDPGKEPSEYAERLKTIRPVMSRVLREISVGPNALGLVDSEVDTGDSQRYFLTEKGWELYNEVMTRYQQFENSVRQEITPPAP